MNQKHYLKETLQEIYLRNSLNFYFENGELFMLSESMGTPDEVYEMAKNIIIYLKDKIKNIDKEKEFKISLTENDIQSVSFMPSFIINLSVKKTLKDRFKGSTDASNSYIIKQGNDIKISPYINIDVESCTKYSIAKLIFLLVGHELTHAYSLYQYIVHRKEDVFEKFNRYNRDKFRLDILLYHYNDRNISLYLLNRKLKKDVKTTIEEMVSNFTYLTSDQEKNAVISQLRFELDFVKSELTSSKKIVRLIKNTEAYGYVNEVNTLCYEFNTMIDYDKEYAEEIVNQFNKYTEKNFTENGVRKYINYKASEYESDFMKKAGKVVQNTIYSDSSDYGRVNLWLDKWLREVLQ